MKKVLDKEYPSDDKCAHAEIINASDHFRSKAYYRETQKYRCAKLKSSFKPSPKQKKEEESAPAPVPLNPLPIPKEEEAEDDEAEEDGEEKEENPLPIPKEEEAEDDEAEEDGEEKEEDTPAGEPTEPPSPSKARAGMPCQGKCEKWGKPWSFKCMVKKCAGCSSCSGMKLCSPKCNKNRCKWKVCAECDQCI